MIYVRQLLNADEISQVNSIIESEGTWLDGTISTEHNDTSLKNNLEYSADINQIAQIIYNALDRDSVFIGKVAANSTTVPIISKTIEGGFYRPHQDKHDIGHYSTTVFLNSPEEYDGGHLRIYDHEVEEYKLEAGHAVTYNTGYIHEVSEVNRGKRVVSVFWTHSHFAPDYKSDMFIHLNNLKNTLLLDGRPSSIEEAIDHPGFMIETISENFNRMYMTDH